MHRYPIKTAAQLAQASYSADTHPSVAPLIAQKRTHDDAEAYLLTNGILLIPGSNSFMDYLQFNLRVVNLGGTRYRMSDETTERGASGTIWHQGFLRHAKLIYDWIEGLGTRPKYIIGHSLGAAATQILSKSWATPGIGFAAPRPRKARGRIKHDELCLCINRSDDSVCALPGGFHHMGTVKKCRARQSVFGPDHAMRHYREVVDEYLAAGKLPQKWP